MIIASVNNMRWSQDGVGDDKNMDYDAGWGWWGGLPPVDVQTTDVRKDGCVDGVFL